MTVRFISSGDVSFVLIADCVAMFRIALLAVLHDPGTTASLVCLLGMLLRQSEGDTHLLELRWHSAILEELEPNQIQDFSFDLALLCIRSG